MPTTSQWKILHALLRAGRLKRTDTSSDENGEKLENNKENNEHQKVSPRHTPQRKNSFHFSKNDRGVLTIICKPKSVPVRFSTKEENDHRNNEPVRTSSNEQTVNQNTNESHGNRSGDENVEDNIQFDQNVRDKRIGVESEHDTKSDSDRISESGGYGNESISATSHNQFYQDIPDQYDDIASCAWDGTSEFPELLDPIGMRIKDRHDTPYHRHPSASALKRWHALNSNGGQLKLSKSVTFSHPRKTLDTEVEDVLENVDDEDSLGINLENVDEILPKFNNPLGVHGHNRKNSVPLTSSTQAMPSVKVRSLRPLKSAPSLRRVSKSFCVFSKKNTQQQRSKSSLSSHTESNSSPIDHGICNDINNPLINSSSCSGGFKIRHTTFAYKEFSRVRDRPRSSHLSYSKVTATDLTKPRVTSAAEVDSFEPFVIQNGRLVRRASMSNGMFAANSNSNAPGLVQRGSAKFSILGKDEATTLSRICDAFIIRGGSGTSRRGDHQDNRSIGFKGLQRPLSGPWPTKAISRWSMATQSIITRSVSSSSLAAISSSNSQTGSGFEGSTVTVANTEEIELPEEVQEDLHKLGFRKQKGKRKKSEKSKKAKKQEEAKEETLKSTIDLKQDPVLVKVQKKNRNVGTFACEPESQPFAICFEIKGSAPSHADVMAEMKKLQKNHPEVLITKLQFDYRALVNNSPDMENRWIVTTNSVASRNRMAGSYIRILGQDAQLRRYDDVITTEYQQYKRMMDFVKMMNSRLGMK